MSHFKEIRIRRLKKALIIKKTDNFKHSARFSSQGWNPARQTKEDTLHQTDIISHYRLHIVHSFILLLTWCMSVSGQPDQSHEELYLLFDKIVGIENSVLHYGNVYEETHRVKSKRTKFFPGPEFVSGSLVFDGQSYFDLPLKYNVYDDELLMQVEQKLGGDILKLHRPSISSFVVSDHLFFNLNDHKITSGFYELMIEKPSFSLFKKHRKSLRQLLGEKLVFYEFLEEDASYFLYYRNKYSSIPTIEALASLFPNHEVELTAFNENLNPKLPFEQRLGELLEYLDLLAPAKTHKIQNN